MGEHLLRYAPLVLMALPLAKLNDVLGAPKLHDFQRPVGHLSPSTMQYLRMLGDVWRAFDDFDSSWTVLEIGAGYGGLRFVWHCLSPRTMYAVLDLPGVLALIHKYLGHFPDVLRRT